MLRMPNQLRQASARAGRWSETPAITVTRLPATASVTRSVTLSSWPSRSTRPSVRRRGDRGSGLYQQQRDQALREIFEITCRLAAYPAVPAFIELQKQLSAAIDKQAAALAARPVPGERVLATA